MAWHWQVDLVPMFINNGGHDHRIGGSTWHQHLLIEVTTIALVALFINKRSRPSHRRVDWRQH